MIYRIENKNGGAVELSALGAGIVAVEVPDRNGKIENVCLAYANPDDYLNDGPCMGKCPGRYANRIAKGHLVVDGQLHQLAINNGPNALHGGPTGFQNRIWDAERLPDGVRFTYRSADGEEGYPGNLVVTAEYHWSDDNVLTLDFEAKTDKATVINLTNHAYWNLRGADSGSVLDHELTLRASQYLPTDDTLIPTADAPAPVENTPMDFREAKTLGRDIKADFPALNYGKGYDACWVIDRPAQASQASQASQAPQASQNSQASQVLEFVPDAAVLVCEASGRKLTVGTDQPGVQIYTGNWLAGCPKNRSGRSYDDYDGVAIEMQGFPDAPNRPDFPSQLLLPSAPYRRRITFAFTLA